MHRSILWLGLIVLSLVGMGCATLQQRVALKRVKFRLEAVQLAGLNLQGVTLKLHWKAINPNGVRAVLDGFELDLFANDHLLTHFTHSRQVAIPARDSTTFVVEVPLTWRAMGHTVAQAFRNRHLEIKAQGRAVVHTPLGDLRIPVFQKTRRIL